MLVRLGLVEQRHKAVLEVLGGDVGLTSRVPLPSMLVGGMLGNWSGRFRLDPSSLATRRRSEFSWLADA